MLTVQTEERRAERRGLERDVTLKMVHEIAELAEHLSDRKGELGAAGAAPRELRVSRETDEARGVTFLAINVVPTFL